MSRVCVFVQDAKMCLRSPYLIHNEQRFPELAVTTLGSRGHDYVYTSPNKMFGGPGADFQDLMVNHRFFVRAWRQLLSS